MTVTLALGPAFKTWLTQKQTIASLEASNAAARHRVASLQHEREQWQDPAFVEREARLRLHYVMPGQTAYVVLGGRHTANVRAAHQRSVQQPWYSQLWTAG